MHIGVDLRCLLSPHRTGVGEYTAELLTAIFNIDSENQYYLFYNSFSGNTPQVPKFSKPNVHFLATRYPNKLFSLSSQLLGFPKLDKFIAHEFGLTKLDYFFSPHLNFTSLSKEVKHILTIHDLTYDLFPNFLTLKQRLWHRLTLPQKQCQNAHLILTPSENTKRDITNFYRIPGEKIKVIYPGLSSLSFPTKTRLPDKQVGNQDLTTAISRLRGSDNGLLPDKYILFLGSLEPRKNIAGLIAAYESAFHNLKIPHDLVIAGAPGWKNEKVKTLAKRSALRERIHFIGFVEESSKPALYRGASIFVYPSYYEGFGFPVLEAMKSSIPVITSNRSSLPEITNGACYLVNPHRPDEIAIGLTKILNSPALAERFIILGNAEASKFNWEIAARSWLNLLK